MTSLFHKETLLQAKVGFSRLWYARKDPRLADALTELALQLRLSHPEEAESLWQEAPLDLRQQRKASPGSNAQHAACRSRRAPLSERSLPQRAAVI